MKISRLLPSILTILSLSFFPSFFPENAGNYLNAESLHPIQVGAENHSPIPAKYDGSMMPYDFSDVDSLPYIPEGYEPIHISYVARHGARFLSSPKKIEKIESELLKAKSENRLSADGVAFLTILQEIADSTGDRWGLLSSVGLEEEQRLGEQMANMFPQLLKSGEMNTISTFVPRVVMTMYEFNHAVERRHTDLEIYTNSGHANDSLLYFFDAFTGYRDFRNEGSWEKVYDDFVDRHVSAAPAARLFSQTDLSDKKLRDLTMEMYGAVQGNRAAGFAPIADRFFSEGEYRECYRASNLKHYLRNTPNSLDPSCTPATAMLIRRIISDADGALSQTGSGNGSSKGDRNIVFSGYFGHAETLLPLLSVMNIPGCWFPATSYENLDTKWQLEDITPLGANLTLIFLRDPSGEIFVSVRHNGRNVAAYPGAPKIIRWSELKAYWDARISSSSRPKANLR